jgi:DNA-binding beta-propeller fold protein YncE
MALHRSPLALVPLLLLGLLAASAAPAEILVETYRSPFGIPWSAAVNRTDGSVWAATGGSVMHLAEDGTVLSQADGFWGPFGVSVNPTDGSCWVADCMNGEVVRLAPDGTELWRVAGFDQPWSVSVNPNDGSAWVAAVGTWECTSGCFLNSGVYHLSQDGAVLWAGHTFAGPLAVSVNPTDGSCWVANTYGDQIVHLAADGTELWRGGGFYYPCSVSADPNDDSCWVADAGDWDDGLDQYVGSAVVHLGADGTELWRTTGLNGPSCVAVNSEDSSCWVSEPENFRMVHLSKEGLELCWVQNLSGDLAVNPADDSCWVAHSGRVEVVHISETGSVLWRGGGPFGVPWTISTNPTDGSCWVTDFYSGDVIHVAEDGVELARNTSMDAVCSVAVNPTDASYWVTDPCWGEVAHFAADGTVLSRDGSFTMAECVSVNPADSSCWVSDTYDGLVVHLSDGGDRLWTGTDFCGAVGLSVNSADDSVWVVDCPDSEVVHLAENGAELWRSAPFYDAYSLSVNPTDGSCWMADWWYDEVIHVAADGTELWRGFDFYGPECVSVNPTDGSCWVADAWYDRVVHLAASGAQLSWVGGFYGPHSVSVNSTDGSCWVADTYNAQIVRLARWFDDVPTSHWSFDSAYACVGAGIVSGYDDGLYHPEWAVTRDQMAVYISRAISTPTGPGSLAEYTPPATPSFSDVETDYWAYTYIEYAVGNNIVGGYDDQTYHPEYILDRGQMAVFIAHAIVDPFGDEGLATYQPPDTPTFPDVSNTGYGEDGTDPFWAYKHVEYIAGEGVCGGYDDDCYHPEYTCTRDQMAVYIARAFDLPT